MTPQDARTLWVAALRSGKYKQGKHTLHNVTNDTYCCLGVACDLYQQVVGDLKIEETTLTAGPYTCLKQDTTVRVFDGCRNYLPSKVSLWLNVDHRGLCEETNSSLPMANDEHGLSFNQIADVIESGKVLATDAAYRVLHT